MYNKNLIVIIGRVNFFCGCRNDMLGDDYGFIGIDKVYYVKLNVCVYFT